MGWGAFIAGLIGGALLPDGPDEDAKLRQMGPEGNFLSPDDRRAQSQVNHRTREYAKVAVEKLPYYARLYNAPNQDQLEYILKPFEAAASMDLKGRYAIRKWDKDFKNPKNEAEEEWIDLLEYFAIGLSEVERLLGERVYAALTQHFSDYFLIWVRRFVTHHPHIAKGVMNDRYQLFEMYRKNFGMRYLEKGEEERAKRFIPVKTSYELYRLSAEMAVEDWERDFKKAGIPEEKWRPLLEEFRTLRLKERMPSLREVNRSTKISIELDELLEEAEESA